MAGIERLVERRMVAVSKVTSVSSAIQLMKGAHVSLVPVLDGKLLFGILERDEAERHLERWGDERNVGTMRLRRVFVELKDTPEKAAKLMVENKLSRLPVVNSADEMRCVGTISATDIARRHKKKLF